MPDGCVTWVVYQRGFEKLRTQMKRGTIRSSRIGHKREHGVLQRPELFERLARL